MPHKAQESYEMQIDGVGIYSDCCNAKEHDTISYNKTNQMH